MQLVVPVGPFPCLWGPWLCRERATGGPPCRFHPSLHFASPHDTSTEHGARRCTTANVEKPAVSRKSCGMDAVAIESGAMRRKQYVVAGTGKFEGRTLDVQMGEQPAAFRDLDVRALCNASVVEQYGFFGSPAAQAQIVADIQLTSGGDVSTVPGSRTLLDEILVCRQCHHIRKRGGLVVSTDPSAPRLAWLRRLSMRAQKQPQTFCAPLLTTLEHSPTAESLTEHVCRRMLPSQRLGVWVPPAGRPWRRAGRGNAPVFASGNIAVQVKQGLRVLVWCVVLLTVMTCTY